MDVEDDNPTSPNKRGRDESVQQDDGSESIRSDEPSSSEEEQSEEEEVEVEEVEVEVEEEEEEEEEAAEEEEAEEKEEDEELNRSDDNNSRQSMEYEEEIEKHQNSSEEEQDEDEENREEEAIEIPATQRRMMTATPCIINDELGLDSTTYCGFDTVQFMKGWKWDPETRQSESPAGKELQLLRSALAAIGDYNLDEMDTVEKIIPSQTDTSTLDTIAEKEYRRENGFDDETVVSATGHTKRSALPRGVADLPGVATNNSDDASMASNNTTGPTVSKRLIARTQALAEKVEEYLPFASC